MNESVWFWSNLSLALPEVFLATAGMALLVIASFSKEGALRLMPWAVTLMFAVTIFILLNTSWDHATAFSDHYVFDRFAGYMKILILLGLSGALLISMRWLVQENMTRFEYPLLVLLAGVGMMLMVSANSMLTVYVGLELQSLSLYVLAAIRRDHVRASEAGLKYFVLGALASGMLLFGISLIYGYIGSIGFETIADTLHQAKVEGTVAPGAIIGMVFILVGIAFKISAVPFHMWTPDVYEGAPTSVTALFAMVPKVAAIGLLMRVLYGPFGAVMPDWQQIIWILSALSMGLGAFAALVQNNIKRLMAYSSIGNVGFALVGIVAGTSDGAASVILYMTIYMIMTAGTFGLIMMMRRNDIALENISDLAGLSKNHPVMAYAMAIMMFSMAGIPPLAGFFAKLMVFQAAVEAGFYTLAVLGVLSSVVAAYYYLRIIKVMFFDDAADPFDKYPYMVKKTVILFCTIIIVGFVLVPSSLVQTSKAVASALFDDTTAAE